MWLTRRSGSSEAPLGPAAVSATVGEGLAHWNSSWTARILFQQITAVWRKLGIVLLEIDFAIGAWLRWRGRSPEGVLRGGWKLQKPPACSGSVSPSQGVYRKSWSEGPGELVINRWLKSESLERSACDRVCEPWESTALDQVHESSNSHSKGSPRRKLCIQQMGHLNPVPKTHSVLALLTGV